MGDWYRPHYRRSLASRVTLLTTMAVGVAVTVVSLASFLTVRSQSMSALDDSLRDRATAAAKFDALKALSQQRYPSQVFGAADVRIIFVDADAGRAYSADRTKEMKVSAAEYDVASGKSSYSARTISAGGQRYRMVAVPADDHGIALVLAQSLEPTDRMLGRLGLVALFFGLAGVIAAALAGWGVARNGLRPVRVLTHAAEDIARTGRLGPDTRRGERRDRPAGHRVQRDALLARRLPRPAAPAGGRRRSRAADPADLVAHQPRTCSPGRRLHPAVARGPGGPAGGRAGPDRGDDHADRRPRRARA
jgi:hypothetical protein